MDQLRILLLVIFLVPLVFAGIAAYADRWGMRTARRTALWLSVVHLLLTLALAFLAAPMLSDRADSGQYVAAETSFKPTIVPGDTGGSGEAHATAWNIFTIAPSTVPGVPSAIQFFIGIDGLNLWLVLLTSIMTLVAVLVSWESASERTGAFYAWIFVLQSAVIGAFLAFDIILFYVCFELTLIPSFFLIGNWGVGGGKRDAARKFFLYTLFGSLLTLTGIVGIVVTNPTPLDPNAAKPVVVSAGLIKSTNPALANEVAFPKAGPISFNINRLMKNVPIWTESATEKVKHYSKLATVAENDLAKASDPVVKPLLEVRAEKAIANRDAAIREQKQHDQLQVWLFFLLVAGFAVKVPLVPFHTWLPSAYGEAPIGVTMLFSALLAKLGTLGMLRIVIPLAPDAALAYGLPALGFLGAVGIVYAALCAYGQRDIKMLAAYSSVSHLGLLVLGMFALNKEGLTGAALHMVNHGLTAGAMFALLAFLIDRYRTTDSNFYSGLIAKFPGYAFFMMLICLASVGLPGLNNFVSEMMLISGLFTPWNTNVASYGLAVTAAAGIFLSAWYTFTMVRKVFFGPLQLPVASITEPRDVNLREVIAFGIPSVLCLGLGLFPQPIIDTMRADVAVVVNHVDAARSRANSSLAKEETPPRKAPAPLNSGPVPK